MAHSLPRASHRRAAAGLATALLVALLGPVGSPASATADDPAAAAPTDPVFTSVSGGSRVTVGGIVRSELTGASTLRTTQAGRSSANNIAAVNLLDGVLTASAISSRQRTVNVFGGGTRIESMARIAGVSLLGGAITVDAIETEATATLDNNGVKRSGGTRFVDLNIRDNNLPLVIPKNFTVNIPGLAKVVLNEVKGQVGGDALIKSVATSIHITLLSSFQGLEKGAQIEITPTKAQILLPTPIDGEPIFGAAYSTRTQVKVGDTVRLNAGPTSAMIMPAGGTNGIELTNAVAKLNLPGLVNAEALSGSAQGTVTNAASDGVMTGRVGEISLLGGVITVDAVSATAHVHHEGDVTTADGTSRLLNLNINGRTFPISVRPNVVVKVPGLVKVTINEQIRQTFPFNGITVRALHIEALPDAPSDIVGLDLEVGVAAIWVRG